MSHQLLPNIKDYRKNLLALTSKKHVNPVIKKPGCSACGKSLSEAKEYARNQVLQSKQITYQNRTIPQINKHTSTITNINQSKNRNKQNYSNKKNLPFENKLHNNFSFSVNF